MEKEYLDAMGDEMGQALTALKRELTTVRTGRASPQLLDNVQVEVAAYGAVMPLNQLASVSAPDARMLVVTPWDKTTLGDIERGITVAGLGLNPSSDGQVVRLPIPPLTGERRKDLTKVVKKYGEEARIRVRSVRKEYNDLFKGMESEKEVSKDDLDRLLKTVQEATDSSVKKVADIVSQKESEILEG